MRRRLAIASLALIAGTLACDESNGPSSPSNPTIGTIRLAFLGSTARRTDLPSSAQACVNGVGATHTHPSWRNFDAIPLQPVPPNRYEITLTDVPLNTRVSFRVNDQNWCDRNPTGAVLQDILVNDVRLIQNTTTPGNGEEPGFAFTLSSNGSVTQ